MPKRLKKQKMTSCFHDKLCERHSTIIDCAKKVERLKE